jgi:hypothetical protein
MGDDVVAAGEIDLALLQVALEVAGGVLKDWHVSSLR